MPKFTRQILVQVADESVYGTDPNANYVSVLANSGASINPDASPIQRDIVRQSFSPVANVQGPASWAINLPIELKGGGIDGTLQPPPLDSFLKAAGLVRQPGAVIAVSGITGTFQVGETISNDTTPGTVGVLVEVEGSTLYIRALDTAPSNGDTLSGDTSGATTTVNGAPKDAFVYKPETDPANQTSAAMRMFMGAGSTAIKHQVVGMRGSLNIQAAVNNYGLVTFQGQGLFVKPTADTPPAASYSSIVPAPVQNVGLGVGAWDMSKTAVNAFDLALNNNISVRPDVNAANGRLGYEITGRTPQGSLDPEVSDLADYDIWTIWENSTAQKIAATIGNTDGNRVRLLAPKAVYDPFSYGDREGIRTYELPFTATGDNEADGGTGGDDEVYLIFY